MSAFKFNLDLHSSQSQVSLAVKQHDTDRSLEITLSDGSEAFILPEYCVAVLLIKKPNGNTYSSGCYIENESVIKFDFHKAVAAEPGINICELKIYSVDGIIASPSFTMIVSDRAVKTEDISIPEVDVSEFDTIYESEAERKASEAQRNENEYGADGTGANGGRVYNEEQRMIREDARVDAENDRADSETARKEAENARAIAEDNRATAENARGAAEDARVDAENARADAENKRSEDFENAQYQRNTDFNILIGTFREEYNQSENARDNSYASSETNRNNRYSQAERDRENAYRQAEARRDYKSTAGAYDSLDERVTNIESYINPKYYITSAERAFERIIPSNACPFIELNEVGANVLTSNNLLNPELFGTSVNENGEVYYPGEMVGIGASITLPAGTYTVSGNVGKYLLISNSDASIYEMNVSELTFTLETEDTIFIHLMGDNASWEDPFYCWVMLNKGDTALPFERFVFAPEKPCDNLIPFPYLAKWSNPNNGITATTDSNGQIQFNGAYIGTEAVIDYNLAENFYLPIGKYTISGCDGNSNFRIFVWIKGGSADRYISQFAGGTTFDLASGEYIYRLSVRFTKDEKINNAIVKPMLNKGESALPYEPYYEGTKSTKVTKIEHYGANLVDDEAFFASAGFTKLPNGYWYGSNKTATLFTNTEKKSGSLSIAYMSKTLTANGTNNSVALALIYYTDGTTEYRALTSDGATEYGRRTYTTPANKTVTEIKFSYGITGTFEIKDLIINWGGVVDYYPYSAYPIFTLNIPQSIRNLNGYGFGTIDFDNKKYIQDYGENGALSNPIVTDISSYLKDFDNTPEVQAGGTLKFINEAKAAIPSTISYLAKEGTV